ncbi:MAG: DUF1571 domain-containing protein [Desulfobacterota bacterium]|nr:DUF1571 domain-containing protein [Thermodesulfobacteriota bacterium]
MPLLVLSVLFDLFSTFSTGHAVCLKEWLGQAEEILERTESYTAIFHKQERIKDWLKSKETVRFKFKKPFKVYMQWIEGPGKGREIYYVEGWNKNRILVREPGTFGTVTLHLNPLGRLAMQGSRHPITDAGLGFLVRLFGENLRRGWASGQVAYELLKEEQVYGRRALVIDLRFPRDPRYGYYCYRTLMAIDTQTKVPIRVVAFDWEERLMGDYGYEQLVLDAGLTDDEFRP